MALLLARNLKSEDAIKEFFGQAVEKFGVKKVKDFMEIQLMHSQAEYNGFIQWYSSKFKLEQERVPTAVTLPQIKLPTNVYEEGKYSTNTSKQ